MNYVGIGIIARRELRNLWNERTIVFAIFLQLFMATFSSVLVVGLGTLYDPSSVAELRGVEYRIALCGDNTEIEPYLAARGDFRLQRMALPAALAALKERRLAAVLEVSGEGLEDEKPVQITLYTIRNDLTSTVVVAKLKEALISFERDARAARSGRLANPPLTLEIPEAQGGLFQEIVYILLLPLLLFLPAVISGGLVIDLITEEYQQNTLETLLSTPLGFTTVVWGKIAAAAALIPVQVSAWLLLLALNRVHIAQPAAILAIVTLSSLLVVLMGAITALHYRERTNAQLVFSTALIVAIFGILSLPVNPVNTVVRLALGSAGMEWFLLAITLAISVPAALLLVQRCAEHVGLHSPLKSG